MVRKQGKEPEMPGHVAVGRIGAAHGVKGEVRLQSFCAVPGDIAEYGALATAQHGTLEIASLRPAKDHFVARFKDVADRDVAEKLNGVMLYVARDKLPEPDEDEFYYSDLVGLEARLADGQNLGRVKRVENFGAGDLLLIALEGGGEEYFAFNREVVPAIRIGDGYLTISPPQSIEVREGQ